MWFSVAAPYTPHHERLPRGTINLEFGSGFYTDADTSEAHPYLQAGLGTVWSIPIRISATGYLPATLYTSIHYALADFPRLETDGSQYVTTPNPSYAILGAIGARVDVTVPLTGNLEAVVGARFWDPIARNDLPESWSLFVGVTVPLGNLLKAVSAPPSQ